MGLRAYLLVNVVDGMEPADLVNALRDLEDTPGVDFVDPVIGSKDIVVMVDAPLTVEAIANKIRSHSWVKETEVLRIASMYERHCASKAELLEAVNQA